MLVARSCGFMKFHHLNFCHQIIYLLISYLDALTLGKISSPLTGMCQNCPLLESPLDSTPLTLTFPEKAEIPQVQAGKVTLKLSNLDKLAVWKVV